MPDVMDQSILGLDVGGTKTLAVRLRRDGSIAAIARAGGANPFDQPGWEQTLILLTSRMSSPGLQAAALGLGGYGESPELSARQNAAVRDMFSVPLSIANDVELAFEGAFAGGHGILILSGTGSMAWAAAPQPDGAGSARTVRVGGWGHGFGDEGSAYWIGLEALRLTTHYLDGRKPGAADLARALLSDLGLAIEPGRADPMLLDWHRTLDHPRSAIATLARTVDRLAEHGSESAVRLLEEAAGHLARHVEAARRRLGVASLPWSYGGSAFCSRPLLGALVRLLGTAPVDPVLPPIGGALLRAAKLAGWTIGPEQLQSLAAALKDRDPAG